MLRSRFFWQLYLGYLAVVVLSAALLGAWLHQRELGHAMRSTQEMLLTTASLLRETARPALELQRAPDLQHLVTASASASGQRLTVLARDGTVLADSAEDPASMENHLSRPEVQESLREGIGVAQRFSSTVSARYLYVALPVRSGAPGEAETAGFVRAALPLTAVAERLAGLRRILFAGAGLAALLGMGLALALARRVIGPVRAMTAMAESLARGEEVAAARIGGPWEIRRLEQTLDAMAAALRGRMETITSDRNKLLAILASMVEGVIAVDREDRVVHMNAVAGSLLGVAPASAVGRRIWEVTRVGEVPQILDATRREAAEAHGEVRLRRPLGRGSAGEALLELRASPLRDGAGALAGAVVVLHDVSELRRLEQVRRDFVANVSHELKTPLTAIRGMVETLVDDPGMPAQTQRRFLERIRDQSSRLSALVGDLLTLARVESQEVGLERRPIDLRRFVREAAGRFLFAARDKGLALEVELPGEPLVAQADEEALRQIADNLLDNALKYTAPGGSVTVRARAQGEGAVLEVADTGIGIEPRDQERVFERFYRVDKARSRELGGTGLGLSIVKHLSLSLGGRVSLESTPGKGSTFRVSLPLGARESV